jgi:hypothetical protein
MEDFVTLLEAEVMHTSEGNVGEISTEESSIKIEPSFDIDRKENESNRITDTGISSDYREGSEGQLHVKTASDQLPPASYLRESLSKSALAVESFSSFEKPTHLLKSPENYDGDNKVLINNKQAAILNSEIQGNFAPVIDEEAMQGKRPGDMLPLDTSLRESTFPIISNVTKHKMIVPSFSQNLINERDRNGDSVDDDNTISSELINDNDEIVFPVPTNANATQLSLGAFAEFVIATKNTSASVASAIALHAPSWATVDATAKRKGLKLYDKLSQFMDISNESHQDEGSEDQDNSDLKENIVNELSDYCQDKGAASLVTNLSPLTSTPSPEIALKESYHYNSSLSLLRWNDSNVSSIPQNLPAIQNSDSELLEDSPVDESELSGIAYVAYGMCLMTKNPLVVQLRKVVANVAVDYEVAYLATLHDNQSSDEEIELPASIADKISKSMFLHVENSSEQRSSTVATSTGIENFDHQLILENLSPINLVTVLVAFLLEYRIVVVSSQALSAATHLGEWLKTAIFPLNFSHLFAPLVPPDIGLQLVSCPTPYFIGCRRSQAINEVIEMEDERDSNRSKFSNNLQGLLVVDIDYDDCLMPHDLQLPVRGSRSLIHALESLLRPSLSKCDDVLQDPCEKLDSAALAKQVMALCRNFVSSLLEGSNYCSLSIEDGDEQIVLFDEALFIHQHCLRTSMCTKDVVDIVDKENENLEKIQLRKRSISRKEIEPLLQRLLRTQCFSSYLSN